MGVCGVVPFTAGKDEIILGDVIVSTGVIQYDLGWQFPEQFVRKDTLSDSLGRPPARDPCTSGKLEELPGRKGLQAKIDDNLNVLRSQPELAAEYPGSQHDRLFKSNYRHVGDGNLV